MRIYRRPFANGGFCTTCILAAVVATGQEESKFRGQSAPGVPIAFNIPDEPLSLGLRDFAQQSHLQLVYQTGDLDSTPTSVPLRGTYTPAAALERLLRDTHLHYAFLNDKTVSVTSTPAFTRLAIAQTRESQPEMTSVKAPPTYAATPVTREGRGAGPDPSTTQGGLSPDEEVLEEVVVTGTHLRGVTLASPILTVTREDIDQSGYSTAGDVIRAIPQDFSGGQNPGVVGVRGNGGGSLSGASSANLRGLGPDATLTLLDGHRIAYDGFTNAVDVSGIPVAAIERIEVVTDGASSIYGSDAVSGVVNFIIRKDYNGSETTARLGGTSHGGATERQISQLLGHTWDSGGVLFVYEFHNQDPVFSRQRSFASAAEDPTSLLPTQRRNSFLLDAHQNIADTVTMFFEGMAADRRSIYFNSVNGVSGQSDVVVHQHDITAGLDVHLPRSWKITLEGTTSDDKDSSNASYSFGSTALFAQSIHYDNRVSQTELEADGPIVRLQGGDVSAALGTGRRTERYTDDLNPVTAQRSVNFAFLETHIPLVGADANAPGINRLEATASGRYESYSDVGAITRSKLGIVYAPLSTLALRASWGNSFRAPILQTEFSPRQVYLFPAVVFGGSPAPNATVLEQYGGNPQLRPETSASWTTGLDLTFAQITGLKIGLTYFDISYKNRIVQPIDNTPAALTNQIYAPFVTFSPSAAAQASAIADATAFLNQTTGPYVPGNVGALVRENYENALSQDIRGVDTQLVYRLESVAGPFTFSANGSWLDFRQKLTAVSSEQALSGTIFDPPRLRARGGIAWDRGHWSAAGFLNYVHGEVDNSGTTVAKIGSWTTVDTQLSFNSLVGNTGSPGIRFTLGAQNLFDTRPPPVAPNSTTTPGLGYDSANASALGRFVSVSAALIW